MSGCATTICLDRFPTDGCGLFKEFEVYICVKSEPSSLVNLLTRPWWNLQGVPCTVRTYDLVQAYETGDMRIGKASRRGRPRRMRPWHRTGRGTAGTSSSRGGAVPLPWLPARCGGQTARSVGATARNSTARPRALASGGPVTSDHRTARHLPRTRRGGPGSLSLRCPRPLAFYLRDAPRLLSAELASMALRRD